MKARGWGRVALLLATLLPVSVPATAQTVQGSVTDSATGHPVIGGLVLLLGARDSVKASSNTTERGTFLLPAVVPGSYRLRVLRIGATAWTSRSFDLAGGQKLVGKFLVTSAPVVIEAITVKSGSACKADPRADADVATLWEEARKALELAEATMKARALEYRSTVTTRRRDPDGVILTQEPLGRVDRGTWPIVSLPADSLAAAGFVQARDTVRGPAYYGPDARVFFSDPFLGTHCFRAVDPPAGRGDLIGVGFQPVRSRKLPDISGVLWLDRRTAELRRLEFNYTRLGKWVPPEKTGGELDFIRLDNGAWIISLWRMTAPLPRLDPLPRGQLPEEEVEHLFGQHRVKLVEYVEQEGRVEEARADDGALVWRAP
ncbi:MAG TPA: carboxypeptidase-like regulatory domain-containing protein [Gemmatimonadales bacterium]|nr:carboxypeptidase-like regulatory domain-containing protein [Gemmatimonadales bacterium]